MRKELSTLEKKAQDTMVRGEEMTKIIRELEQSITQYKEEYAVLISEANAIKADLATVEAKVKSPLLTSFHLVYFRFTYCTYNIYCGSLT